MIKKKTITLAGSLQGRNSNPSAFTSYDQNFLNCVPELIKNQLTNAGEFWVNKFPAGSNYISTSATLIQCSIWSGAGNFAMFGGLNGANFELYKASNKVASIATGGYNALGFSETRLNGVSYFLVITGDQKGYYFAENSGNNGTTATTDTVTFTGTTHSNTTMDGISNTSGFYAGQAITGSGISANTYVQSVDTANSITLSQAASSSTTTTFTRTTIAKILDSDFPPNQSPARVLVGNAVHMDGYMFVLCYDQTLWNTDVNSLTGWTITSFTTANSLPDPALEIARLGEYIVVLGANSVEFYVNAGNPTGSVLQRVTHMSKQIGVYAPQGSGLGGRMASYLMDDVLYWVSTTSNQGSGQIGVNQIGSVGGMDKISDTYIDKLLNDLGSTGVAIYLLGGGVVHGQKFISLKIDTRVFNYYIATKIWWEQSTLTGGQICGVGGVMYAANGVTSGLKVDPNLPQSYSGVTMRIRTQNINMGSQKKKKWHSFEVEGDIPTTSGNATLSYSNDDFVTTAGSKSLDPSTGREFAILCGTSRRRSWSYTDAINRPRRIKQFHIEYEELSK